MERSERSLKVKPRQGSKERNCTEIGPLIDGPLEFKRTWRFFFANKARLLRFQIDIKLFISV